MHAADELNMTPSEYGVYKEAEAEARYYESLKAEVEEIMDEVETFDALARHANLGRTK